MLYLLSVLLASVSRPLLKALLRTKDYVNNQFLIIFLKNIPEQVYFII